MSYYRSERSGRMNILYISKLSGNMWAGPNNSVPAQIMAQTKFDFEGINH